MWTTATKIVKEDEVSLEYSSFFLVAVCKEEEEDDDNELGKSFWVVLSNKIFISPEFG